MLKWRMRLVCGLILWLGCCYNNPCAAQASIPADTSFTPQVFPTDFSGEAHPVSDSSNLIEIAAIQITGNRKTKDYIIFREVDFHAAQTMLYSELEKKMRETHDRLMNTALFLTVNVSASRKGTQAFIEIDVREKWYIFPLPYFKVVDRNFNEWWVKNKGSLDRINYGVKFTHNNFSGRKDKMQVALINGYNRQLAFNYAQPYADKSLTRGFEIGFLNSAQRELAYRTDLNKQVFLKESQFIRTYTQFEVAYLLRPALKTRHSFRIGYNIEKVNDTILKLNPHYSGSSTTTLRYPEIAYSLTYTDVDYVPYPSRGLVGDFYVQKKGIDKSMNVWQAGFQATYTHPLFAKSQVQFQAAGVIRLPFDQPFYNQSLFGSGDMYLRGLEYYTIDGVAGLMGRVTARKEIVSFTLHCPFKNRFFDAIPFRFFLKAYSDVGYAYTQTPGNNPFANKLLKTWGVGLDMLTIYDFVLRFEYSFNQLGNNGLFLHPRSDF